MKKKKVLVCGASGFLGRNIFERLLARNDLNVFGTCHTKRLNLPNLLGADLTDLDSVRRVVSDDIDVVIQAAAVTAGSKAVSLSPHSFITDNVVMNSLLLQEAHRAKIPQFIFPSCSVMYPRYKEFVSETDVDLDGIHPKYFMGARIKLFVEDLGKFYSSLGNIKFTAIRHSNIYGPYDKFDLEKSHFFGSTITKVMSSQDGKIVVWGEGKEKRDVLYVSDVVDFVEKVLDGQDYDFDIFNIGCGKSFPVAKLAEMIIDISKRDLTIEFDATKPVIDVDWALDYSKAAAKFGWYPKTSLRDGIEKTIAWYKANIKT